MRPLTDRQTEIRDFIREWIGEKGYAPTVRDIGKHFGIRSPNGVTCFLKALEKKGEIKRDKFKSRSIRLTEAPPCPHCGKRPTDPPEATDV